LKIPLQSGGIFLRVRNNSIAAQLLRGCRRRMPAKNKYGNCGEFCERLKKIVRGAHILLLENVICVNIFASEA